MQERVAKLPILAPENQARYLVALIQEEDAKGPQDRRLGIIVGLMGLLVKITAGSPVGVEIHVHRSITLPPEATDPALQLPVDTRTTDPEP